MDQKKLTFIEQVLDRFEQSPLDEEQVQSMRAMRDIFKSLAAAICSMVPAGRNQAEALTCLETASMYAIKGICKDKKK